MQFGSWNRGVWPLLTQGHTKTIFNGLLTSEYGVSQTSFLCATSGVVTGLKPRLFSGAWGGNGGGRGGERRRHGPQAAPLLG